VTSWFLKLLLANSACTATQRQETAFGRKKEAARKVKKLASLMSIVKNNRTAVAAEAAAERSSSPVRD
jgi:hypothetical protein